MAEAINIARCPEHGLHGDRTTMVEAHRDEGMPVRTLFEALAVTRRATFDPGKFTKRVRYHEAEFETLERWQARAVLVALAAPHPDDRYSAHAVQTTRYELEELERLGVHGLDEPEGERSGASPSAVEPGSTSTRCPQDAPISTEETHDGS